MSEKVGDNKGGKPSGCPMHANPSIYGREDLTYNDYLKVDHLLGLQNPQSSPAHHDEMLFIVIHQAYELWFKLILHEMENAISYMVSGQVLRAHHFMNRINQIMKLLVQQIHILETMTPAEFLQFRDQLNPASGFQSTQFREIEFLAGLKDERYFQHFKNRPEYISRLEKRLHGKDLRSVFYQLLRDQGFKVPENASEREFSGDDALADAVIAAIKPIYQDPAKHSALYMLSESLVEFDEYLALWREHHVRVVERVIGHKRGTGGSSGVDYLRSTTVKKCFPRLWEVRTYLE
jgi:tryptophan 2,3-dioxygenase